MRVVANGNYADGFSQGTGFGGIKKSNVGTGAGARTRFHEGGHIREGGTEQYTQETAAYCDQCRDPV
jgi:hypothetical protein